MISVRECFSLLTQVLLGDWNMTMVYIAYPSLKSITSIEENHNRYRRVRLFSIPVNDHDRSHREVTLPMIKSRKISVFVIAYVAKFYTNVKGRMKLNFRLSTLHIKLGAYYKTQYFLSNSHL